MAHLDGQCQVTSEQTKQDRLMHQHLLFILFVKWKAKQMMLNNKANDIDQAWLLDVPGVMSSTHAISRLWGKKGSHWCKILRNSCKYYVLLGWTRSLYNKRNGQKAKRPSSSMDYNVNL